MPSAGIIWNDEAVARLGELRDRGLSAARIAAEMGTSRNAVIGKLNRVKIPTEAAIWTPEREQWLRGLVANGATQMEIGMKMKLSRSSVSGKMLRLGLKSRSGVVAHSIQASRDFWTHERAETLRQRWAEGASAYQIAREIGSTEKSVKRKRAALGLEARIVLRKSAEPRKTWAVLPPSERPAPRVIVLDAEREGVSLSERVARNGCAWPVNSWPLGLGDGARFCGDERADGASYCLVHRRRLLAA